MNDTAITPYKGRDADTVINQALQMYEEQGIEISQAAKTLDVPARTIHRWLATNASERWREVQQARALADYEKARTARDDASKTLSDLQSTLEAESVEDAQERNWRLAHAREVLKAADTQLDHQKWLLERLLAKLYGQQNKVTVEVIGDLGEKLRRAKERVIDVIPEKG